jgi:hypothetical protein
MSVVEARYQVVPDSPVASLVFIGELVGYLLEPAEGIDASDGGPMVSLRPGQSQDQRGDTSILGSPFGRDGGLDPGQRRVGRPASTAPSPVPP